MKSILMAVMLTFLIVVNIQAQTSVELPTVVNDNKLILTVAENSAGITGFNCTLSQPIMGLTTLTVQKTVDWNVSNIVIYGTPDDSINIGDICELEFVAPQYGSVTISFTDIVGCSTDFQSITVEVQDGIIAVSFSAAELAKTVDHVLQKDNQGIDANGDGSINIVDIQIINKYQE